MWDAVVWGSPLILTATFIVRKLAGNDAPLVATYWLGTAALIAVPLLIPRPERLERPLRRCLVAALIFGAGLAVWAP